MAKAREPFEPSGALPIPQLLREYNEVVSGSAAKIMESFHQESQHRREQEQKTLDAEIASRARGQFIALVVATAAITGSSIAASKDPSWASGAIGAAGILTLATTLALRHLFPLPRAGAQKSDEGKAPEASHPLPPLPASPLPASPPPPPPPLPPPPF